jgi:hypothetical protein
MCSYGAVAVAGLVLAVATTAYTTYDTDQTVKAQNHINQQAADEGAALANESFKQQAGQARLKDAQEAEAASQEKFQSAKAAAQARETERVSSGEAGVSGVSVDNLIADFYRQEASYSGAINRNLDLGQGQTDQELQGLRSGALDRAIALKRPTLQRPSYLAAGVTATGQALDTYSRYRYTDSTSSGRTQG